MLNNGRMNSASPIKVLCPDCAAKFQIAQQTCPHCGAENPFDLPQPGRAMRLAWVGLVGVILLAVVVFTLTR